MSNNGMAKAMGPIGTILGAAAGIALAPVSGGTSLALTAGSLGAGLGGTIGGVVGGSMIKAPKLPDIAPTIPMPDQSMIGQAQQQSIADQLNRRGRASTILSQSDSNSL